MPPSDSTGDRGIVNDRERQWLRDGLEEIEPKSPDERAIRQAIRHHLKNAILDFSVLYQYLEDRDRQMVFESEGDHDPSETQLRSVFQDGFVGEDTPLLRAPSPEVEQALIDAVAFLWANAPIAGIDPADLIETGVKRGYTDQHPDRIAEVDLDLDWKPAHTADARATQKMRKGEELTDAELRAVLREGREDPADVAAYLRGEYEWPPEGNISVPPGTPVGEFPDEDDLPSPSEVDAELDEETQQGIIDTLVEEPQITWEEHVERADTTEQLVAAVLTHRSEEARDRILDRRARAADSTTPNDE